MLRDVDKRVLLPTNVRPTHYTLTIAPDLGNFTFQGSEVVNLNINENTKTITFHANELEIKSAKIVNLALKSNQTHNALNISKDVERHTITLTFPQELAARTTATLHIEYSGVLTDRMVGFYRSSFKDQDGKTSYMASTQFEATEARRAFPSWDEPSIKATFDITLIVPSDMTALGNMNVVSETRRGDGKKVVKFARTPIMSTYLVAFVVGDLGYIEAKTTGVHNEGQPVVVRVYAPKGEEQHGEFALNIAKDVLEYFAEVFGIPYPLTKCDMVAIPDFEFGAMENWGLITYRTTTILFNNKASDARFKERIAYTVSHELAHQWFGNLVTMEWWTHLWLNEGFATWVGYLAVDKLFPKWETWNQYVTDGFQRGLALDGLKSSHPIEVPVNNPSEIHQIFDAISYYKGANVIRMLSEFLGEKKFLDGVKRYLLQHKFGNATTEDLWNALAEETGNNVKEFMTIWTKKTGYPVLTVEEIGNTLRIRQKRYLSSGEEDEDDDTIWWVPLGIDLGESGTPAELKTIILTSREMTLTLPENYDFYQLNRNKTGVFRVNYPPERLVKLGQAVKEGKLPNTSDRIGIMADAGALASSGFGKTSALLSFIKEFGKEEEYIIWCEINARLSRILNVWFEQPEPIYKGLLNFQRQLVSNLTRKLGWDYPENEDYFTTMLRTLVIKMSGKADDPETIKEAFQRFYKFKQNDESALHPNLRGVVFDIVLSHGGGNEEFDFILRFYHESRTPDQKVLALNGLGSSHHDELIQRALKIATSDEVRSQDIIYAFSGLQSNRKARRPLWNYLKENWYTIHERYSKSIVILENIVKFGTEALASEDDAKDIDTFFSNKNCKEFERSLHQSIENVQANAAWLERDKKDVESWLKNNGYLQ